MSFKQIVYTIVIGLGLLIAWVNTPFYIVEPWEIAITKTLGTLNTEIKYPWRHGKLPFLDSVVFFSTQTQKDESTANAASKDLQSVSANIAVNYSVDPSQVLSIYTNLGTLSSLKDKVISPSIQEAVKSTTSKYTAEELVTKRQIVSTEITDVLKEKLGKVGISVSAVNIVNFSFSESFDQSIENKVKAEQDALAQKNKLEQVRYEAEQQILKAKAEAETIRIQANAIQSQWGKEYVELKMIEKRDWKLPVTSLGTNNSTLLNLN